MSAAGSPVADGSPTASAAPAVPGIDGAELAFRMVQAAESAASAAAAATQALSSLSSTSGASTSSGDWFKVLPKPSTFDPKDREAELSQFRDWWWQVEQYVVAVDPKFTGISTTSGLIWKMRWHWLNNLLEERREVVSFMVCLLH